MTAERSRSPLQGHHRVLAFLRQRDQEAKATQEARDTLQYMRDQETAFGSDSGDDEASSSSRAPAPSSRERTATQRQEGVGRFREEDW